MTSNSSQVTDNTIRAAAIAHGFTDISIISQRILERAGAMDAGEWLLLSTKRNDDADWEFVGRRKTKGELVGLLDNAAARFAMSKT